MIRLVISVSVYALLSLCTVAFAQTASSKEGSTATAERPVWPPAGSTWKARVTASGSLGSGTRESVLESQGQVEWEGRKAFGLQVQGGPQFLFDPDRRLLAQMREGKPFITYLPHEALYEWPLVIGKSWTSEFQQKRHATGKIWDYKFQFMVETFENVSTPAGEFRAFRIRRNSPHDHDHYIVWYEPVLGIQVKHDWERYANHPEGPGTNRMELLSHSITK
jgi:hypothetical protein